MAQEAQCETSQQAADSETETGTEDQASVTVIEIHDSTTECEEEVRPSVVQMEEKTFVLSLHSFMKDKGTPIERIPHLGFKQINLWRIYKAVDKLGGYDSVTARRLWKKVYDELGGSPGSTSAATCTRRHYERLVLPFERHLKGEENKPLPSSKPRKPYKRNLDGKVNKAEGKKKKTHLVQEPTSERINQRSPEAVCQSGAVIHGHAALWASDRHLSDCPQPNRAGTDLLYAHVLQAPTSSSWFPHIPSTAGEVISPLEKKKRMAQASLNLPRSSPCVDIDRPSVISRSQSPSRGSSDGSPFPLSSSSSRSPSPLSVSSEDSAAKTEDKPASSSELPQNPASTDENASGCGEESRAVSRSQTSKEPTGQSKNTTQVRSPPLSADSAKSLTHDSAWRPYHKGTNKYFPFTSSASFPPPTSTSSFTKVIPKSVQLVRPAPVRPSYKVSPSRAARQDDSLTCTKKMSSVTPWPYQAEKKEKSRTMQQRVPPSQQSVFHSTSTLPTSCVLSGYDKPGRESRHQPQLQPTFLSNRMRLPQSSLVYRHVPVGPALIGPAVYPYPYSIPLVYPQTRYTLPSMNPIYPRKL